MGKPTLGLAARRSRKAERWRFRLLRVLVLGGLFIASLSRPPAPTVDDALSAAARRSALGGIVSVERYETLCLALAIYYEARGEPEAGRQAVALVVLNRQRAARYPRTLCGVVFQNARLPDGCQFSFACAGKPLLPLERGPWREALRTAGAIAPMARADARAAPFLREVAPLRAATHYHAIRVNPSWSRRLKRLGQLGGHVFFAAEPPQAE